MGEFTLVCAQVVSLIKVRGLRPIFALCLHCANFCTYGSWAQGSESESETRKGNSALANHS